MSMISVVDRARNSVPALRTPEQQLIVDLSDRNAQLEQELADQKIRSDELQLIGDDLQLEIADAHELLDKLHRADTRLLDDTKSSLFHRISEYAAQPPATGERDGYVDPGITQSMVDRGLAPATDKPTERETKCGKKVRILCYDRDLGCSPWVKGSIIGLVRDPSCEELMRWNADETSVDNSPDYDLIPTAAHQP